MDTSGTGWAPERSAPERATGVVPPAVPAESLVGELLSSAMLFGFAIVVTVGTVLVAGMLLGAL